MFPIIDSLIGTSIRSWHKLVQIHMRLHSGIIKIYTHHRCCIKAIEHPVVNTLQIHEIRTMSYRIFI